MVEWVGLSCQSGFKFLLGFAAVFAEEIGGFEVAFALGGQIQRCAPALALRIHIRAIGDKQFDYFLATSKSRFMQRSPSINVFRIHIRATSQVLFDGSDVFQTCSLMNCGA